VVARPEDEELLLAIVPIASQARETAGAVVQPVREDPHAGLPVGNDPAAEEGVFGEPELLHDFTSSPKWIALASNPAAFLSIFN
jgi:hypothetical protein